MKREATYREIIHDEETREQFRANVRASIIEHFPDATAKSTPILPGQELIVFQIIMEATAKTIQNDLNKTYEVEKTHGITMPRNPARTQVGDG